MEKRFMVSCNGRSYPVMGHDWNTLESVWNSQKCWFMKGSVVTVSDENENSQKFVRE